MSRNTRIRVATIKAGFHTRVSRTHNSARCMDTTAFKQSQPSHMLCRDVLWPWPVGTDNTGQKIDFLSSEKNEQCSKQKNITTTFGKSLFLTQYRMRYAIYIPPKTKDLAINLAMVAYGNQQNATTFARANNSDLLRSLKHVMETRLTAVAVMFDAPIIGS